MYLPMKRIFLSATNVRGESKKYSAACLVDKDLETYWATDDDVTSASVEIDFGKDETFNRFLVQEYVKKGQRVKDFNLEVLVNGEWMKLADELCENEDGLTTIGRKRIICFPAVTASKLRFTVVDSKACPLISNVGVYYAPEI